MHASVRGEHAHARADGEGGPRLAGDSGAPNHAEPTVATLNYLCPAVTGRGSYRSARLPSPARALTWIDRQQVEVFAPMATALLWADR